ncbi:hypothetical protein KDL01_39140 [Actinospica durhamensis]|uniref:Uncharacterized protein n=1 Tax=Actinospica durhamensis TaxID=1508375 RepID=A0A941EWA6_9ACTN|nr:hypothetical protein [Actinospica durhamensis]MBR7839342.1 hypothetical protein [Actinospica durhamensis]
MAPMAKNGVAGTSNPAEKRKLVLLILRLQLAIAALMTVAVGCLVVPALLAAHRYDSAPHCATATQGPDCVALVPVTVASVGQVTGTRSGTSYWLELTGIGAGQTQFTPTSPDTGAGGLVSQARQGQQLTAVLWHGDLVEVESADTVAVDSGSPDIQARNWLGSFALPLGCLLGLLIMYLGKRRPDQRGTALAMTTGALVILNGPTFSILQDGSATRPSPLLALATFAGLCGLAVIVTAPWVLYARSKRRKHHKPSATRGPQDAMPHSRS